MSFLELGEDSMLLSSWTDAGGKCWKPERRPLDRCGWDIAVSVLPTPHPGRGIARIAGRSMRLRCGFRLCIGTCSCGELGEMSRICESV